jgi:hypothetical protein
MYIKFCRNLLAGIVSGLDGYSNSEEGIADKLFEFAQCKYLIREFYYETNLTLPFWEDTKR